MHLLEKHKVLIEMLKYRRPAGSRSENKFINRYIRQIKGVKSDGYGNLYLTIGDSPETMFTAHTDSVHREQGKQKIAYDASTGDIILNDKSSNCLGADDATGIYIMLQLIANKVNGLYVFFREEEIGGNGSDHAYMKETYWKGVKRCISFDRRGCSDVITHQYSECSSLDFASALALQLNDGTDLQYCPDNTGVFTDSANFVYGIHECTNISVGYDNEHTAQESQNLPHLDKLIDALLKVRWDELPTSRDCTLAVDEWDYWASSNKYLQSERDDVDWAYGGASSITVKDDSTTSLAYIQTVLSDPHFKREHLDDFLASHGIKGKDLYNWFYMV